MKKHSILFAFATLLSIGAIISACSKDNSKPGLPTEGIVAYYQFDGNTQDASGFGNHGSRNGADFVDDRKGNKLSALYFDGVDDYVQIPNSAHINFGTGDDFTISLWIKYNSNQPANKNTDNDILAKWALDDEKTEDKGYPFTIRIHNNTDPDQQEVGTWNGARWDGDIGGCKKGGGTRPTVVTGDNVWHHIVFIKNKSQLFGYVDNTSEKIGQDNTTCDTKNQAPLRIGLRHKDGREKNNAFQGYVDDLRIYNRALSKAEIELLYKE